MKITKLHFKSGDKVKCISSEGFTIKKGEVYTVSTTMIFDDEELLLLTNGYFTSASLFKKI